LRCRRIESPDRAIGDFKAYVSRALNVCEGIRRRWARGGNSRLLLTDHAIQSAIRYVIDFQGEPMAVYVAGVSTEGEITPALTGGA
jgi:hypothetical protein